MNGEELAAHLRVKRYGRFTLTDAVRPAWGVPVRPRQGYRTDVFRAAKLRLPMLTAAVSAEHLFDTFIDLLTPLGATVDVVLESSHGLSGTDKHEYRRDHIDTVVVVSHFYDFEQLLLDDGNTGVSVVNLTNGQEVQFDEHKTLTVFAKDLRPFVRVLRDKGIRRRPTLTVLSEAEHLHHSTPAFADQFDQLARRVGVSDTYEVLTDESL